MVEPPPHATNPTHTKAAQAAGRRSKSKRRLGFIAHLQRTDGATRTCEVPRGLTGQSLRIERSSLIVQTRSDFIASGTLAFLAPAATGKNAGGASPSPSASPSPQPSLPPLHFDLASFDTMLNVAAPHRHLFASTKVEGGIVLGAMRNTLNAYRDIGISLTEVRPVAVLYHGLTVTLGFDDTIWNEYFIPIFAAKGKQFPTRPTKTRFRLRRQKARQSVFAQAGRPRRHIDRIARRRRRSTVFRLQQRDGWLRALRCEASEQIGRRRI